MYVTEPFSYRSTEFVCLAYEASHNRYRHTSLEKRSALVYNAAKFLVLKFVVSAPHYWTAQNTKLSKSCNPGLQHILDFVFRAIHHQFQGALQKEALSTFVKKQAKTFLEQFAQLLLLSKK